MGHRTLHCPSCRGSRTKGHRSGGGDRLSGRLVLRVPCIKKRFVLRCSKGMGQGKSSRQRANSNGLREMISDRPHHCRKAGLGSHVIPAAAEESTRKV